MSSTHPARVVPMKRRYYILPKLIACPNVACPLDTGTSRPTRSLDTVRCDYTYYRSMTSGICLESTASTISSSFAPKPMITVQPSGVYGDHRLPRRPVDGRSERHLHQIFDVGLVGIEYYCHLIIRHMKPCSHNVHAPNVLPGFLCLLR